MMGCVTLAAQLIFPKTNKVNFAPQKNLFVHCKKKSESYFLELNAKPFRRERCYNLAHFGYHTKKTRVISNKEHDRIHLKCVFFFLATENKIVYFYPGASFINCAEFQTNSGHVEILEFAYATNCGGVARMF